MRTTFNIEDGLLEEAKSLARQRKTTLGAVVSEALRVGLLRAYDRAPAASNVPLKTFRGDGLQAGVDLHHSSELLDIMERS
jgi:hypothetical protein